MEIFKNSQFGEIRVAGTEENPYFCLKDICQCLDLLTKKVSQRLDDKVLSKFLITDSIGRERFVLFVNEDGLYDVIFDSRKPEARAFRKWVTSEVIPSIRKTGSYSLSVPSYQISDPIKRAEKWIEEEKRRQQLAIENKTKQKKIEEQQHTIEQKDSTISDQKKQIEESQPAVTFTNAVSGSKSACLIGELAKLICQNGVQIGQNRLFEWLRKNHYLGSVGERRNIPNQEYIEQGLFIVKKGVRTGNDGVLYTTKTTKVTGKGQVYFINKFLQNKNNEAH